MYGRKYSSSFNNVADFCTTFSSTNIISQIIYDIFFSLSSSTNLNKFIFEWHKVVIFNCYACPFNNLKIIIYWKTTEFNLSIENIVLKRISPSWLFCEVLGKICQKRCVSAVQGPRVSINFKCVCIFVGITDCDVFFPCWYLNTSLTYKKHWTTLEKHFSSRWKAFVSKFIVGMGENTQIQEQQIFLA